MGPAPRTIVLAARGVRRRVTLGEGGEVQLFWDNWSLGMSRGEFVDFAGVVAEAVGCPVRCGELARGCCGMVSRCSMGQILVSHGNLSLWFSPEEFDGLHRLTAGARGRLADAEPPPVLGVPWAPRTGRISAN